MRICRYIHEVLAIPDSLERIVISLFDVGRLGRIYSWGKAAKSIALGN